MGKRAKPKKMIKKKSRNEHSRSSWRRVALVANSGWYLYNFRLTLLYDLRQQGFDVVTICPEDEYAVILRGLGFATYNWKVNRKSINPIHETKAIISLVRAYKETKPSLVHHFTIKACVYGTIAAKASRVYRVINAITGLGHLFVGTKKRTRALRRLLGPIYRMTLSARRSTVIFQNANDQERLIQLGITNEKSTRLIMGSGVDIKRFTPTVDNSGVYKERIKILFPSRLIREKGIEELIRACKLLWEEGEDFDLAIAGSTDYANRSSLGDKEIEELVKCERIMFLGHRDDMDRIYEDCDIVVLPSWREGLSRSLIEASAMERPIITTDVPGCRDVVDHGSTGLLVEPKNSGEIKRCIRLLLHNPDLARKLGKNARSKVSREFEASMISVKTIEQYLELLKE